MSLCAIIPIKPLNNGKSRLSEVLLEEDRVALNTWLYQKTLRLLTQIKRVTNTLVVSKDMDVLAFARAYGAIAISEDGVQGLNAALTRAVIFTRLMNADRILILPADLPLINKDDLEDFIDHGLETPQMVISPDRHDQGTNALMVAPPNLISFAYGPDSYTKHSILCRSYGASLSIVRSAHFGVDLDTPEDLVYLEETFKMNINTIINQPTESTLRWRMK